MLMQGGYFRYCVLSLMMMIDSEICMHANLSSVVVLIEHFEKWTFLYCLLASISVNVIGSQDVVFLS